MSENPYRGIICLNPLVLTDNGEIDHIRIGENIVKLENWEFQGVMQFAGMGQGHMPSNKQFRAVLDTAVSAADEISVFVGCFGPDCETVANRLKYAEKFGATGAMVPPPSTLPITRDWIGDYYREITKKIDDLPIMVYNFPLMTEVNIGAELWDADLADINKISAVKDSNFSFLHHNDVLFQLDSRISYISPGDSFFWHDSIFGARGFIGILAWVAPSVFQRYYTACLHGNHLDSWVLEAYRRMSIATARMTSLPGIPLLSYESALLNAIAELGGGHGGPPKSPFQSLPDSARVELEKAIQPLVDLEDNL